MAHDFVTIPKIALLLGGTEKSVRRLVRHGAFGPAHQSKPGGLKRYALSEVERVAQRKFCSAEIEKALNTPSTITSRKSREARDVRREAKLSYFLADFLTDFRMKLRPEHLNEILDHFERQGIHLRDKIPATLAH
jgi:hypothetical protein